MIFNNYKIVRKAVNLNLVNFIKDYFILKRDAVAFMNKHNIIDQNEILGTWADKQTKLNLVPTYSYARIYKNGDELKRHKDRGSCELSTTVHLGGDPWPIYLEPSGKEGLKGKKVNLKPGDMLIYKGCELEHWRNIFKGKQCLQVFLHYNDVKSKFATTNKFDTRPMLGLPTYFKQF